MKIVKGQQQLTSRITTFSSFVVLTTIVIAEDGDGVAITSFGTKAKVVEVGSNVEVLFFHVILVIGNFGNNYLCSRGFFWTI